MLLAVRAEPAEVAPGERVKYSLLVVAPSGRLEGAQVDWAYCATPKRLTDNTVVSEACAREPERALTPHGIEIDAQAPQDACVRFGSDVMLPGRPHDPDLTGGYY